MAQLNIKFKEMNFSLWQSEFYLKAISFIRFFKKIQRRGKSLDSRYFDRPKEKKIYIYINFFKCEHTWERGTIIMFAKRAS